MYLTGTTTVEVTLPIGSVTLTNIPVDNFVNLQGMYASSSMNNEYCGNECKQTKILVEAKTTNNKQKTLRVKTNQKQIHLNPKQINRIPNKQHVILKHYIA